MMQLNKTSEPNRIKAIVIIAAAFIKQAKSPKMDVEKLIRDIKELCDGDDALEALLLSAIAASVPKK